MSVAVGAAVATLVSVPAFAEPGSDGEDAPSVTTSSAPTDEELKELRAEGERLASQVADREEALKKARAAVDAAATRAAAAQEAERVAQDQYDAATREEQRQIRRLDAAKALVTMRKGELGRWAAQTYRRGGASLGDLAEMMTLLDAEDTDELGQRAQMLELVGRWRGSVVDTVEEAEAVQEDATVRAAQAAKDAETAAKAAKEASAEAAAAYAEQSEQVALMASLLDATLGEAERNTEITAEAAAAQARLAKRTSRGTNRIVGEVGECAGLPTEGFANGSIPEAALCPLWAASGHLLRADAAYAFNQLSEAYASRFGAPICVTDSYRNYSSQVAVRAAKPGLAAIPGTSNHGWGTATDLCGGIQTFGTAQHEWMRANAPLFGFFHPTWAQQNGSKPEPWHWEFGD